MNANELLSILKSQEVALHQPELRRDINFISRLLHDDFMEFGRSGSTYSKSEIVSLLTDENPDEPVQEWSQDYHLHMHDVSTALLLYKSAHVAENNELTRHTLRSSLWKLTSNGWQMLFHQGTSTAPFDASTFNESLNVPRA